MHWSIILIFVLGVLFWFLRSKKGPAPVAEYIAEEEQLVSRHQNEHSEFIKQFAQFDGASETFRNVFENMKILYGRVISDACHKRISMDTYLDTINKIPGQHQKEIEELCAKYMIDSGRYNDMIERQHRERIAKEEKWLKIMEPYITK